MHSRRLTPEEVEKMRFIMAAPHTRRAAELNRQLEQLNPSGSTSTAARENHTTALTPVFRRSDYFVLGGAYLIVFLLLLVLVCIATGPWILP